MKFSIITINYNNAQGLEHTLTSIFSQTYQEFEYIVIDGGSSDGSKDIIQKYSEKISYWISENDNGVYNAMNKGIRVATGDYLLFLNSGDYLSNEHVIEHFLKYLSKDADLVYGNLEREFPNGNRDVVKMPPTITVERMLKSTIFHPVTLIKRTLFSEYGLYDERLKIVADWAFFLKVVVLGHAKCQYIDFNVSVFSMDGLSSKLSNRKVLSSEKKWVIDNYLSPTLLTYIQEKQNLDYYYTKYRINTVNKVLSNFKSNINCLISRPKLLLERIKQVVKFNYKTLTSDLKLRAYKEKYKYECFKIPIVINNRNHLSYLKRLIKSLETRGYKNIFIIDNNSDYQPLLDFYKDTPYKVFTLNENVGYCALWDTNIFDQFRDQYYVYTDSDLEIIEECPDDFMVVMHFLLNKYPKIGKVGFSLLTDDIPEHYVRKDEVKKWESRFQENKTEKLSYLAQVDTTFALYKPNAIGIASMLPALRTSYPYSARHLPWYENSLALTEEHLYYYKNARTSTHWSFKAKSNFI